jgi:hypothetical protein
VISARETRPVSEDALTDTIFSLWRLVNSQHESILIRQESAHMTLKVLDRYKRQHEPITYTEVLENIGAAATGTLVSLLEEAKTAELVSCSTASIRKQAQTLIEAAAELH